MTTETTPTTLPSQPGFGRRFMTALGRFLKALLKVVLVLAVIAAIGYITFLIVEELQRSFEVVNGRVNDNREQVLILSQELNALENTVATSNTTHDERLITLESYVDTTLADDLARQEEMLTTLDLQLGELLNHTETVDGQIVTLNEGVVALQGDMIESTGRLDSLGGEIDSLSNDTGELTEQVTGLQTAVNDLPLEDIEQMRQVVTLFRVWEMVTRARLRLVENNAGLAASDTALALATIQAIAAHENTSPDLLPQLALVQARLTLANAYLPANPALAALDLENAWNDLDAALGMLLGIEGVEEGTAVSEEGATPTPTPAPSPTPVG